jgi:hypothetical protein
MSTAADSDKGRLGLMTTASPNRPARGDAKGVMQQQ